MPEPRPGLVDRDGVVITGVAAAACLGVDAETIWREALAGTCGMAAMPAVESPLPEGSVGGQAAELPERYQPTLPREARYLRWTIEHALRDAGLAPNNPFHARTCAVLGTTLHGIRAGGRFLRTGDLGELESFTAGATASLALDGLGVEGGALTTCSACASSLGAVALGVTLLETGQAEVVLAGGYDGISEYAWAGFNSLRLIAGGPLRPFCQDRQGMKVAEGYGIVVLELASRAHARGATVRARIAGWGESSDAHHLTQPHPKGDGALAAMEGALQRAGIEPLEVGVVAAHATGTPDNDGAEYAALSRLFGQALSSVPVVGFKSMLGHTLGGAGAVELVMSSMALRDGQVPGCSNVRAEDIEYPGLSVTSGAPVRRRIGHTMNTSLGFGGANSCVVLADPQLPSRSRASVPRHEVWITGVGVVLPGAVGHAGFVERVRSGRAWAGGTVADEAMAEWLNARRTRRLSQYVKATLAAATMAVRDAEMSESAERLAGATAVLGTMHGSACFCHEYYSQIVREGVLAANPVLFAEGVPNSAAAHLSSSLGVKGGCQTIIGSRTAALDALAIAALRISIGDAQMAIVVAAEEPSEVVERAYRAVALQSQEGAFHAAATLRGFQCTGGGVAYVLESRGSAEARGAAPYAAVLESSWAMSKQGKPAQPVAAALARLNAPGRIVGSACGTWVDRAERIGVRRAGLTLGSDTVVDRFGEAFSATPLIAIAAELAAEQSDDRFTALCTDWTGAVSCVSLNRLCRTLDQPKP